MKNSELIHFLKRKMFFSDGLLCSKVLSICKNTLKPDCTFLPVFSFQARFSSFLSKSPLIDLVDFVFFLVFARWLVLVYRVPIAHCH